jgi:hypothetical protein
VFPTLGDLEDELGRGISDAELPKAERALRFAINRALAVTSWMDWEETDFPQYAADAVTSLAVRRFQARTDGLIAVGPFRYGSGSAQDFTAAELATIANAAGVAAGSYSISIATPDP